MKASWVLAKAVARCVTPWSGAHASLSGPHGGVGTMMPGETPPPPAGTAAAGRACANCGVLQQNMNEYVAALIALKQKIIDGDRLLTEYQQKCTELQFAEREISALRCQVEKMLQKILPLEKCQEELGSLKAELEEKKNSLKIYQETQLEYVKIKEEILNSDAVRKKLETKVKKLEEAATKHTQDFRQLKTEKKRLEKELKKVQGKLDGVIKEKCRKFKHAETQSSSEDLATYIDKGRAMFLLEQLRMCIDSAKGKRENEKNDPVLDTIQIHQKIRKSDGKTLPWCSSGESAVKQNSVTAMIIQTSTEPFGDDCAVNRTTEEQLHSGEDKNVDVIIQTGREHSTSGFSSQEQRDPGGNVMDILNWARPLPALLSPVQLSPLTTQDMFLGEVTGSSDEEDDCSTSALEDILQEDQVQPLSCNVISPGDECNRQCKSCEHGFDAEISLNLSWNEKNIHISPKTSRKERDAERKQAEDSQSFPGPVPQVGGFKAIASTSTAFLKAGSNLKSDSGKDEDKDVQNQQFFSNHLGKRTLLQVSMPRSAKRLRLESEPPRMEPSDVTAVRNTKNTISEMQEAFHGISYEISDSSQCSNLEESLPVKKDSECQKVSLALKKVAESCFDLLPVIKGHVYVGNISKIPVMRDEEREVVYEFGIKNKHLAESLLCVILNKLKAQKNAPNYNFSQALCRLYAGICRQLGDLERARLFCYSLLKEDYPDSEKLILFITNVWSDIFVFQGAINKAMQLVVRRSASNEMLACLSAYLNWEESSSLDAGIMVSNLLLEMQSCTKVEFHLSEQYGEDLSEDAWQYIFAVDLLCSHMKWDWTHDNVISKVLWPSMDNWIKKRKGHETAQSIRDSVIALTLRLIGRLGQIGLKEGYLAAVKNISSVIGLFVQHAKEEAIPWGVQLAAVYSLCDLGSSNPEGIVEAIHTWRTKVHDNIPSAITDGIAEITSLCEMELN
uniref:little elongation complex subunit 1 isoform X7 n=1 Tax=Agelaius phoeniceus TaxID=39638 RepID=UPI0023EE05D0|nr:little elongation complex subunit 1 isoform X7 [Agelaius phoeniceus]